MEIPYTISTRPDTGLWNAKVGIWLFLASEVMLFGGLFSAASRPAQRSGRNDEYGDLDYVLGHGCSGLGRAENAALPRLLVVHARHHHMRHHLSFRKALLRMAAEV